jgi:thiosulfate/3-mercaptopyruvate sulfurtransferase
MPVIIPNLLINTETLASRLNDTDQCCIDCRFDLMDPSIGQEQYLQGHIPGAVYADLDADLAGPVTSTSGRHPLPDIANTVLKLRQLGIGEHTRVTVYDSGNGAIAARAWWLLRYLGHNQVTLLDGGFARWQREGRAVEAGVVARTAATFDAALQIDRVIETADLTAAGDAVSELRLVDARDSARFRGEVEPIDAVAGHIPGALNLPFTECLNQDGTWRSSAEIRQMLARVLGDDLHTSWSVMCGSGVTACHLAVSGLLAGYEEPRLYVGSWSEWIRDPKRKVVSNST